MTVPVDVNAPTNVDVNAPTDVEVDARTNTDVDVDARTNTDVDVDARTDLEVDARTDLDVDARTKVDVAGDKLTIEGDEYKAFAFTATQGVSSAVLAAAAQCNEVNNEGFSFNIGSILGAIGFADTDGKHEIADERCLTVVTSLQKLLNDDQQLHELALLERQLDHYAFMKVLTHVLDRDWDPKTNTQGPATQAEHAAGLLAVAKEVVGFEIGLTSAVIAKKRLSKTDATPEDIYTEALMFDLDDPSSKSVFDLVSDRVLDKREKQEKLEQVEQILIPTIKSGELTYTIGNRDFDEAAAQNTRESNADLQVETLDAKM